jgi:hypothetical protein
MVLGTAMKKNSNQKAFPWPLLWLLLLFLLPLCLATALYVFHEKVSFKIIPSGQLQTPPILAESIGLTQSREAKGKWQLVYLCQSNSANEELQCQAQYDLLKRIHLSLGKDQSRVYLSYSPTYPIATEESPIKILENNTVLLIDPRGFLILQYSLPLQKPKGLLEDIRRLLRYSHVG